MPLMINQPSSPMMRKGHMSHGQGHYHGFCPSCCHPVSKCCCGHRECRKVPKELLVESGVKRGVETEKPGEVLNLMRSVETGAAAATETEAVKDAARDYLNIKSKIIGVMEELGTLASRGKGSAIIGGGCCVHLSIEYMPANPGATAASEVLVTVADSEGTLLGWGKEFQGGYHVKECIISTNPGARLVVVTANAVARVRWCEIFSC